MKKSILFLFLLTLALVFLDQSLKIWVFFQQKSLVYPGESIISFGNLLNIVYVENNGIAFGFLAKLGPVFKFFLSLFRFFAVIFIFFFFVSIIKKKRVCLIGCVPFSLILSGALGNVIDSVFYGFLGLNLEGSSLFQGKVIDMFSFSFFPPVFNLADSFVCVGVFCLFVFQTNIVLNKKQSIWSDLKGLFLR